MNGIIENYLFLIKRTFDINDYIMEDYKNEIFTFNLILIENLSIRIIKYINKIKLNFNLSRALSLLKLLNIFLFFKYSISKTIKKC